VALVTGGGTGIGKAVSKSLVENGARVAIASRDLAHLDSATRELPGTDSDLMALRLDIRKKEEVGDAVSRILRAWGRIDVLVNNAGISGMNAIEDADDQRWYDIVDTNLSGTYLVTKAVLKSMKEQGAGRIINVSSVLGKFGVPGYTAYCATKHGIIGFTRALALELASYGITVNAVCPGWVDTAMARQGMADSAALQGITVERFEKQAIDAVPIRRFVDPEEVAGLVTYLASDSARGVTGQAINICGGQTMV
jgi:ketoreductase